MLPSLATVADIEAHIGHTIYDPAEQTRAQALLNDASALVRHASGASYMLEDGSALGEIPDIVVMVTCTAALRAWYNPAGIEAAQLGAVSVRYGGAWLSQAERDMLATLPPNNVGGLSQITLSPGYGWGGGPYGYVPVDNQENLATPDADWFPLGT